MSDVAADKSFDKPLRRGWTTGACATAAARAAFVALHGGAAPDPVEIALPSGQRVAFALRQFERAPISPERASSRTRATIPT